MLAIKNSLMAESATRQMGLNYASLSATIERLSSGLRVKSARGARGGSTVRELMSVEIGTIEQDRRSTLVR